ncbi:MAG: phosphate signaling complex protein PhoU [Bacilli bacterium]|jgi:phosphate transport system protein|nr:phosphate signaling complex protein PhoU [Bacilli bacterium]MDD3422089.1 phosphate signaling complex protein PhoU [Bacilli bacterium]MDD4065604.1 phosphate signaling complex protein PhoU [Bacilli bacterium]
MRNKFDEKLKLLNRELIEMGALCEEAITAATQALFNRDLKLAATVAPLSSDIDHKERDIESRCLTLLLQQQPVAKDLRQISAALKMITDMERIGDQAEDIAEIVKSFKGRVMDNTLHIASMAKETIKMVTDSVDSFVKQDVSLASAVILADDVIDNYFAETKKALTQLIAADIECGEYALDLLMITKYFERIGDHATNIAEWVIFSVSGVHESLN